ncbi:leucine-rich repeat-containing protein 23 [Ascaphus truei]|uniref:leucine-rich repeat-containing protein 23 n=1 Tax=Ascaphus truei TaxID=8439 RepID=UPI003F5AD837
MSDLEDEELEGTEPLEESDQDMNGEEEKEGGEEEEQEMEEPEQEEPHPHMPLNEEMLKEGLSLLCKTGNGLAHAYVKLDVKDRELTDISVLQSFIHLRYVDLSQNFLRDLSPLGALTHMLFLRVDQNQLLSAGGLGELPYLQIASLAYNRIQNLQGIAHPRLESLNLVGNQVRSLEGLDCTKLCSLHTLEIRGNQLQSTAGLNLSNLRELYLAQNNIKRLEGLESLVHLTSLHLRDNQLETLDGFSENLRALQYLNVRGNLVAELQEVPKLSALPILRALVLRENPCEEEEGYRMEILIALPHLERLDKDYYENEEKMEADEARGARLEEETPAEAEL